MKKVLIGCAGVAVVLMIAVGIGGYFVFNAARGYIEGFVELAERVPELNAQVVDQSAYAAPADAGLSADQIERYMGVQQTMTEALGARYRTMEAQYAEWDEMRKGGREPGLREIMQAWQDMLALIIDAKQAQVQGLNEQDFSLAEYHWVREQVLLSLGHGFIQWNVDELVQNPGEVGETAPARLPPPEVLEENRALLQAHEETMEQWLALSFFGL